MEGSPKFVDFNYFCPLCVNHSKKDNESPCYECLEEPVNIDSRRPVKHVFTENGRIIFDKEIASHKRQNK